MCTPCGSFFEWKTESNKEKQPYFIYFPEKRTLTLAGLYSHWVDKETGTLHRYGLKRGSRLKGNHIHAVMITPEEC
jgi:putative SOS response-associated peptidase YedK